MLSRTVLHVFGQVFNLTLDLEELFVEPWILFIHQKLSVSSAFGQFFVESFNLVTLGVLTLCQAGDVVLQRLQILEHSHYRLLDFSFWHVHHFALFVEFYAKLLSDARIGISLLLLGEVHALLVFDELLLVVLNKDIKSV